MPMPRRARTGSERVRTMKPARFTVLSNSCLKTSAVLFTACTCQPYEDLVERRARYLKTGDGDSGSNQLFEHPFWTRAGIEHKLSCCPVQVAAGNTRKWRQFTLALDQKRIPSEFRLDVTQRSVE